MLLPAPVLIILWIVLLVVQILLALVVILDRRGVHNRDFPISSMRTVADTIETYSRVHGSINVKVNPQIPTPAMLIQDTVLISRNHAYQTTLYPNFLALYMIQRTSIQSQQWFQLESILPWVFLGEIIIGGVGILAFPELLWAAITVALMLIIATVAIERHLHSIRERTLEIAQDLLDLDNVEFARAAKLVRKLGGDGALYPIVLVNRTISFISPL